MAQLNRWQGIGNVGQQPENRVTPTGLQITTFSIAINDKNKDGSENTTWFNIVVFNKLAEIVAKYVNKSALVYVEGRLLIEKYQDKNGIDKINPKIIAEKVIILTSRKQADEFSENVDDNIGNKGNMPAMMDFADDIPF